MDLEIEVSRRTAARADLAASCHTNASTVLDSGRNIQLDRLLSADPSFPGTFWARIGNDRAMPLAGCRGDHLPQEGTHSTLHSPSSSTGLAFPRRSTGLTTGTIAVRAHLSSIDLDILSGAESNICQAGFDNGKGILSTPPSGHGASPCASGPTTTEEGFKNV